MKMGSFGIPLVVLAGLTGAFAQGLNMDVPLMRPEEAREVGRQSDEFNLALEGILKNAAKSTVKVWGADRRGRPVTVSFGTVVGDGTTVLTKWSEVEDYLDVIQVQGGDRSGFPAVVEGVFPEEDLVLLKLGDGVDGSGNQVAAGSGLVPVKFVPVGLPLGKILTAVEPGGKSVGYGVVGVLERNLRETDQAQIGVEADGEFRGKGVRISGVQPEYGAAKAGIQEGDVILQIDERRISGLQELRNALSGKMPGDKVKMILETAGKEREVEVVLSNRPVDGQFSEARLNIMEAMGGKLNRVRSGFSRVVQSDMKIQSNQIGGPVVDLEGRVVGITVARADRTKTYLMGSEALMMVMKGPPRTLADAREFGELRGRELAEQREALRLGGMAPAPAQNPERMARNLSDLERLLERIDGELGGLEGYMVP